MKRQELFQHIVTTLTTNHSNPPAVEEAEIGEHFSFTNPDKTLTYLSANAEADLDELLNPLVGEVNETNRFSAVVVPLNDEDEVSVITRDLNDHSSDEFYKAIDEVRDTHSVLGLDVIEIIVLNQDPSKFVITSEGDEIYKSDDNFNQILHEEEGYVEFTYKDNSLVLTF